MTPDMASIIDELEAEIGRLVAELAVVRRDWQSDVGTLTARAQTAEARAARLNTEVGYLLEENEEMGRREMQRAAAARKVARYAAQATASMGAMEEQVKDARAEAARLREALSRVPVFILDRYASDILGANAAALRGPAQSEKT